MHRCAFCGFWLICICIRCRSLARPRCRTHRCAIRWYVVSQVKEEFVELILRVFFCRNTRCACVKARVIVWMFFFFFRNVMLQGLSEPGERGQTALNEIARNMLLQRLSEAFSCKMERGEFHVGSPGLSAETVCCLAFFCFFQPRG